MRSTLAFLRNKCFDFEHSLSRLIRLKIITSTGKYANEYYKTRVGKVYNTKNGKKVVGYFPNLEKNFIYFSL